MNENMEVKAVLTAEDNASPILRQIKSEVDRLTRSITGLTKINIPNLNNIAKPAATKAVDDARQADQALRDRWIFQGRMQRQQAAEARQADQAARVADVAGMARLRETMVFMGRMSRQRQQEAQEAERQRRSAEAATARDFRARMGFASRMARQQAREVEQAERSRQRADAAAERDEAAALRRKIAGHRYVFGLRQRYERDEQQGRDRAHRDMIGRGWDFGSRGREAVRDIVRPAGVAAIAGTAAAGAATRRVLGAEANVDSAEINTRAYGGLSGGAARQLRDRWAVPLAEVLGAQTDKLLTAWTDAVKLGIPTAGAKSFAELSTKTSEAWQIPFETVTDIMGTVNTLLTSKGETFDIKRLNSVANTLQHLAAKQSTTPEKMISFLQRGAGAAQVLGMSQEAGLAFGSASTSLGNQAGSSGRLFDYVASRIIEMPRLTKQHGSEGEQARKLLQDLGYGSAESMDRQRRANPDAFLPDFMNRFNRIKNPKTQDQAIRFFTGREWLGEFGRMVKGIDTYKEAVKLAKEAKGLDAIGAVWELHRTKLAFVLKQFRAGWLNILAEFGKVLSPMARQAGDFFLGWTAQLRAGGLAARFKAGLEGLVSGLGFQDLPSLLTGIFGKPGEGAAGSVESWKAAARGFGSGVKDIVDLVVGSLRRLSGGTGDPEAMARWTGRIAAFSAAMVTAGPAVVALGSISSAILALGGAATAAWTAMRLGAVVSGPAAAGAGAGAAVALRGVVGRVLGGVGLAIVAELGARRGEVVTGLLSAMRSIWGDFANALKTEFVQWKKDGILKGVLKALDPNLKIDPPRAADGKVKPAPDADVPGWRSILNILRGVDSAPARVERQSSSGDWRGMIRPASFRTADDLVDGIDRLGRGLDAIGARVQLAALAGQSRAAIGSFGDTAAGIAGSFQGSGPGGPGDPAKRFGSQFFTPGSDGPRVPGWFGGSGRGSASSMPDPGAGTGPYKGILDHIAKSEGTANQVGGGYDTSLGYGRFLPGGREQKLTDKSLSEILQLGDYMRQQPGNPNSSALGRYQIVGKTLRGLMGKLGLSGNEKFDAAIQDRLGAELVRQRGADPSGLGNEWASLRGQRLSTAVDLARQIPHGASTLPGHPSPEAISTAAEFSGKAGAAVDVAKSFEGMGEHNAGYTSLKKFMGREIRGSQNAWCAAFVNSSLKAVGLKGTGSGVANSFLGWGKEVEANDIQKGDVAVEHRGRGLNGLGGHVGFATGKKRINDRGELELEITSGNSDDRVKTEWERASKLAIRRSTEAAAKAAVAPSAAAQAAVDGFSSTGWKAGVGGNASALANADRPAVDPDRFKPSLPGAKDLDKTSMSVSDSTKTMAERLVRTSPAAAAAGMPDRPSTAAAVAALPSPAERGVIGGGERGAGGSAGGPQIHAPITINAANQSPSEMGSHLQRHIGEAWNFRAHDLEPELS